MVGCCEYGDEPSGSGATYLVYAIVNVPEIINTQAKTLFFSRVRSYECPLKEFARFYAYNSSIKAEPFSIKFDIW
jgi:hypothetical protein